jgi:hypothetical protein
MKVEDDAEGDFLKAVVIVTEHFCGAHKSEDESVTRALELIGATRRFDVLGHAVFRAMLRADMERLRARRAALVAELPGAPKPQLH